jgi:alpha-ketoglutarate-dependent taurine dioxygenase
VIKLNIIDKEHLNSFGWIKMNQPGLSKLELLHLSEKLGKGIPSRKNGKLVEELSPCDKENANSKSLSELYGIGYFPLHTDTAYWKTPARYIILYAVNPGIEQRPTLLLDSNKILLVKDVSKRIINSVFKVVNGRNSFLCNALEETSENIRRIRFDQGCMHPTTNNSKIVYEELIEIIQNSKPEVILWEEGDLLVIDNWRVLHGRGEVNNNDNDRILYRITIHKEME